MNGIKGLERQLDALMVDESCSQEERTKRAVRLYYRLGKQYSICDKFVKAQSCFDTARTMQREMAEIGNFREEAENFQDLGYFYRKVGDYSRALFCYRQAMELLEKNLGLHDLLTERACYLLGLTYLEDEQDGEALYYLQRPCPLTPEEEDPQ